MIISRSELIRILGDGAFHSGEELAHHFGVARASVSKAVAKLSAYGLDVHSVRGKGYRLADRLVLLGREEILGQISPASRSAIEQLEIFESIDSTNTHLLKQVHPQLRLSAGQCRVCLSEMQTAGRGRRGRKWMSPFGHNIYLSMLREFGAGTASLDGLSLVVSLAVVHALRKAGIAGLKVKWPNDLLAGQKKIAGVLLEMSGDALGTCHVVIGIGLNLKLRAGDMQEVSQPWTTLQELGFDINGRNQLVSLLLEELIVVINEFQQHGFSAFRDDWSVYDVTRGVRVEVVTPAERVTGVGHGVDDAGRLLLNVDGEVRQFNTGEVSLRIS